MRCERWVSCTSPLSWFCNNSGRKRPFCGSYLCELQCYCTPHDYAIGLVILQEWDWEWGWDEHYPKDRGALSGLASTTVGIRLWVILMRFGGGSVDTGAA